MILRDLTDKRLNPNEFFVISARKKKGKKIFKQIENMLKCIF